MGYRTPTPLRVRVPGTRTQAANPNFSYAGNVSWHKKLRENMRQLSIIITLFLQLSFSFGQADIDTVYLDSKWKETSKDNSVYFRTIVKDSTGLYDCKDYWISGELQMEGKFSALYPQTRQGEFKWYHKNGQTRQIINYKDNNSVGLIRKYNSQGDLELEYIYKIDSLDNSKKFMSRINDFQYYVSNNLRYPELSRKASIEGKVMTKFYINNEGKVEGLEITESVNSQLDNEAKRVITSYKKWPIPLYKGNSTYIELSFPVIFMLH